MQISGIDEKDNRIIDLLLENGRMSYSEIGDRIGLTRTSVKNRISCLEEKGIIEGYRVIVNPQKSMQTMTFVVNIETTAEYFEEIKKLFAESPETRTVVQTTGNCHLLAICVTPDVASMRDFVHKVYKKGRGIQSISSHAVLDVIKGSVIPEK